MTFLEMFGICWGSLISMLILVFSVYAAIGRRLARKYTAEWAELNPDLTKRIREIDGLTADYNEISAEINMYKKEVDFLQNEMKYVLNKEPYQEALISYYSKIEVLLKKQRDYLELIRERNEYVHLQCDYVKQKMPRWLWY